MIAALVVLPAVTMAYAAYFLLASGDTRPHVPETFERVFWTLIDVLAVFLLLVLFDAVRGNERDATQA